MKKGALDREPPLIFGYSNLSHEAPAAGLRPAARQITSCKERGVELAGAILTGAGVAGPVVGSASGVAGWPTCCMNASTT